MLRPALCSVLLLSTAAAFPQDAPPREGPRRADDARAPGQGAGSADAALRVDGQLADGFDPSGWELRLADRDLDLREQAYAELLALARGDARARSWIETAALGGGEVAWTLRLLNRELAVTPRTARWSGAPFGGELLAEQEPPWTLDARDPFAGMRRELERLREDLGTLAVPGGGSSSESIQIQQQSGRASVTVTERSEAGESTRSYEGSSLEEILRAHPELGERIGLGQRDGPQEQGERGGSAGRSGPGGYPEPLRPGGSRAWTPGGGGLMGGANGSVEPDEPGGAAEVPSIRTDVLGVYTQPLDPEARSERGLEAGAGLLVTGVYPGTIAQAIGLAPGDVLIEVGGSAVYGRDDISRALAARGADQELGVTWIDADGSRRTRTWRPCGGPRGEVLPGALPGASPGSGPRDAPEQRSD